MSFTLYLPSVPAPSITSADSSAAADASRVGGDIALAWSISSFDADLFLSYLSGVPIDLATDRGLTTAAILSLFTDRRAENDDVPPSGDPRDRRGYWADQFAEVPGDRFGSRLWLLDRSKLTRETGLRAKEYVLEALAWMVEDKVVASVDCAVEVTKAALLISVGLQRPGRDAVSFQFSHTWDHMQEAA